MSAVSMNVTPRSSARLMVAMDSSQSVGPYHSLIPMQPSPWADTVRSPSLVVRMCCGAPFALGGTEAFVPAQGVLGQAALLGGLADGPGGHILSVGVRACSNANLTVTWAKPREVSRLSTM